MRRTLALASLLLAAVASARAQQAPAPAPPAWTTTLGAGLALTSGNNDTSNVNVSFGTAYDPKSGRTFKADALYVRGEAAGVTQVDKTTASARYEKAADHSFWLGELSYLRDPFKDIDYLIAPIAGAGVHLIETEARTLSVDAGAGAAFQKGGAPGASSSAALQAGQAFAWAISPHSRLTERLRALWSADDFDDSHLHFEAAVATTLATRLSLKISYAYDYENQPPPDLEKGDGALIAAVVWEVAGRK